MSLELTCQILMFLGLPVNKIIKQNLVFTEGDFMKQIKADLKNNVIIWDDLPYVLNPSPVKSEIWGLWGWYHFQKWGFNL